jgi:chorismate dehydratase
LTCGLEAGRDAELVRAAPADLRRGLCTGALDAALLPSIELQHAEQPLMVLPAGCVASAGRSLAARLFSHGPAEELDRLAGAAVAPTSAAMARVLWALRYQHHLAAPPWDSGPHGPPAEGQGAVVEGDAVMTNPPLGFDHHCDPGRLWYEDTGLPFVYAVWAVAAQHPADCERLYRMLLAACRRGRQQTERIVRRFAGAHGWPEDLAGRYLLSEARFEFTDACRDGLEEFFFLAAGLDVIDRYRPVAYYEA